MPPRAIRRMNLNRPASRTPEAKVVARGSEAERDVNPSILMPGRSPILPGCGVSARFGPEGRSGLSSATQGLARVGVIMPQPFAIQGSTHSPLVYSRHRLSTFMPFWYLLARLLEVLLRKIEDDVSNRWRLLVLVVCAKYLSRYELTVRTWGQGQFGHVDSNRDIEP